MLRRKISTNIRCWREPPRPATSSAIANLIRPARPGYKGRKPTARNQAEKIKALYTSNVKAPEIAAQLGISERSV